MSGQGDIKEFPDLTNKLSAPTKKSIFERQKAEAEAKRLREAAETAAVYDEFVKSFDDEGKAPVPSGGPGGRHTSGNAFTGAVGPRAPTGPAKRHFAPSGRSSGPGSLGPPPNLSRKRAFDGSRPSERPRDKGLFAFEDNEPMDAATAFRTSENEDHKSRDDEDSERTAPKPTLQLSLLPPGTSPAVIRSLIPPLLTVDGVRIIPPAGPGPSASTERKSMSAIVTLAHNTPANDIETVVSSLQNKYLGWGFNLSLSRHLSSAALGSMSASMPTIASGLTSLPFNARPMAQGPSGSLNRAPPPSEIHRGGIAPPAFYGPQGQRGPPPVQVQVNPPSDIKQLKLIHKTLESLLTHGPEFEALLMSRPEVRKEEKWAWIWNPRSPGGIWYRWRLWQVLTGVGIRKSASNRSGGFGHRIVDGGVPWAEPEEVLQFEFTTHFSDLVSDSDYDSSDEDNSGDERDPQRRRKQFQGVNGPPPEGILNNASDEQTYLNPLQKAKLTHLLARLPTSTARLRKGDVARVTAFAISHAGKGAEEVVDMLVSNVLRPFCRSKHANPKTKGEEDTTGPDSDGAEAKDDSAAADRKEKEKADISPATLIGVHLISDILSASSTSGVRHAWKYRALFENALTARKTFAYLGRLEKTLGWGRLRAEKWRRSINVIFQLWEGWCVFPAAVQERFVEEFAHPPLTKEEEEAEKTEKEHKKSEAAKSKWRAVEAREAAAAEEAKTGNQVDGTPMEEVDEDVDGEPMEDVDGAPMDDVDGSPMDDMDGEPMDEDEDEDATQKNGEDNISVDESGASDPVSGETAAARARARRVKAEDMFAESDGE